MSTKEESQTRSSDSSTPNQLTNGRRTFTLEDKRRLLRKYDSVKERMSLLKFTRQNGISRRTFRNWLLTKEQIFTSNKNTHLNRFRQRNSEHPELDSLLYEWFVDFKKRLNDIPVTRDLLLKQAHKLASLLEKPIQQFQSAAEQQTETEEDSSSDGNGQVMKYDFEFSADMFVSSFLTSFRICSRTNILQTC